MRLCIFFFLIFLSLATIAQDNTGLYSPLKRSGDPQGGSVFFVTDDNHWGVMAFGTAFYGEVKKINDTLYKFSHLKPKSPFSIFSRYSKDVGDSTRLFFSDFSSGQFLIHFERAKAKEAEVQDIYNNGANCFTFPVVVKLAGPKKHLSLSVKKWAYKKDDDYEFYNYKCDSGHNDFVVINNSEVYFKKGIYMIIKDSLMHEKGNTRNSYKLKNNSKSKVAEMKMYLEKMISYPDTVFYSAQYKQLTKQFIHENNWIYNKSTDTYSNGKTEQAIDEDYNRPIEVQIFRLNTHDSKSILNVPKSIGSLLHSTCND